MFELLRRTLPTYRKIVPSRVRRILNRVLWQVGIPSLKLLRAVPVNGGHYVMFVNPKDQWGFNFFLDYYRNGHWLNYEPYERPLFIECVQANPQGIIVDIGASYGFYTLDACGALDGGHTKRIIALEPDRDTFACLRRSLEANGFAHRVIAINAAAVDEHGVQCPFYRHTTVSGWNKLVNESADYGCTYHVRGVTLDGLLGELGIDAENRFIIKIDIEGSEPRAFKGMKNALAAAEGYLVFSEFHPPAMKLSGHDPYSYAEHIWGLGNDVILEIDELGRKVVRISSFDEFEIIIRRCADAPEWFRQFTNILFGKNMSVPIRMNGDG